MKSLLLTVTGSALIFLPTAAQSLQNDLIGVTRAVAIAENQLMGRATEADLESKGSRVFYEVDVVKGGKQYEVHIDARSGKVLATIAPRAWSSWFAPNEFSHVRSGLPLAGILTTWERRSGGKVTEVSYDVEAGQPRYEIEIATGAGVAELYVDPRTGNRLTNVYDD